MMKALAIPLAIPEGRCAISRLFIDLSLAFRTSIYSGHAPKEPDVSLTLIAVAVMEGHAEGRPRTASQIARRVKMPVSTTQTRLNVLRKLGVIERIGQQYYLEPDRAANVPHLDAFELILSKGIDKLGPILTKSGK